MVIRESNESKEHEALVLMMAKYYQEQGYTDVKADLSDWEKPDQIGEHIPDVTAINGSALIILEAETCKTINHEHTESQFRTFANNGTFEVAIPKLCSEKAHNRLTEFRYLVLKCSFELSGYCSKCKGKFC